MTALQWAEVNGKIGCANLIRRHLGMEDYNVNHVFLQFDLPHQIPFNNVDEYLEYYIDEEEDEFDEKYSQYLCDYE